MTKEQKLKALCTSMGDESPMLNVVLKWYSSNDRDMQSAFTVSNKTAYFTDYSKKGRIDLEWDLQYQSLGVQSEKLINFLYELI